MSNFMAIMAAASQLQEQLSAEGYDDDDILGAIESETDVLAILDRVAEKVVADERLAASARERARRLEARADKRRQLLDLMMTTIGRDKVERPLVTLSYRNNPPSLILTNPDHLPSQYMTAVPNKDMITKALKSGAAVDGATLGNPSRSLILRTA
jgi:Gp157 protein